MIVIFFHISNQERACEILVCHGDVENSSLLLCGIYVREHCKSWVYADDVNLIGRSNGLLNDAAVRMEEGANEVGLRIN